jgi:hypothetical protein
VRFYYFGRNAVRTLTKVLQLDRGEVLVPAYHHGVEIEALLDAGASVRFYPVDARMQVDPDEVARLIGPRTRGIYLIHYLGFPGPAQALRELCDARGLALVEDCALGLLSRDGDRPLGSWGDAAIFSLYKTLPLPNGGALVLGGSRPVGVPPAPGWSAVIVNYESGALLADCVDALLADDSAGPVEVVVVDNGSADGSVARLRDRHPGVTVMSFFRHHSTSLASNPGATIYCAPASTARLALSTESTVPAPTSISGQAWRILLIVNDMWRWGKENMSYYYEKLQARDNTDTNKAKAQNE